MREILDEFLKPQSPFWPEVKLFLSMCKSAGQRLPMEVQVWNIMTVRRGLKRLTRLTGDEDPVEIQDLLQWITDRTEIAGAFCLQRLKIGHQVNWICALLASIARIRQFCVEVLEKLKRKGVKRKLQDSGTPLDRNTFAKLQRTDACATAAEAATSAEAAIASTATAIAAARSITADTTTASTAASRPSTNEDEPSNETLKSNKDDASTKLSQLSEVKNHPLMKKLKVDIEIMSKAHTDAAKKASLKKVYGIALKRSLFVPVTDENIKKVYDLAMKKARSYCK